MRGSEYVFGETILRTLRVLPFIFLFLPHEDGSDGRNKNNHKQNGPPNLFMIKPSSSNQSFSVWSAIVSFPCDVLRFS